MITRVKLLRDMASQCRSIAEITKNPKDRQKLLQVADQLERLARRLE
jgi:hypothetical protein